MKHATFATIRAKWYMNFTGWLACAGVASHLAGCASAPPSLIGSSRDDAFESADDGLAASAIAREIEEADIVKVQDGYFYLANPFKGLRIIDARSIDQPVMMGGVQLGGRGVELFVRDDLAFVFTAADFFRCAGSPIGFDQAAIDETLDLIVPEFVGSRLWIVDVSDKAAPSVVSQVDLDGFVIATRRVGDVIYAAGNMAFDSDFFFEPSSGGVFVTSINIADPENVFVVETETFQGSSLDMHVSSEAIYVVGPDPEFFDSTLVSLVDISDPAGDVVPRDQFRVPGFVQNRFYVDEFEDVFRIITEEFVPEAFATVVALYTYDVSNPDDVVRLARLPIIVGESLRAVRFDGVRGYAVTFLFTDPLFVLDLSDPANPLVSGELEVPGFSTHLVPLGDRLVGVGFDDTDGFRPSVALYDVADPSNPQQLSRIIVGEAGSFGAFSEATVDEKALRVIEDAGLILMPFSSFDREAGQYVDSLQIIELSERELSERGRIDHSGLVRRADLLDERLWVLSDQAFQSVNVDDLDSPVSLANLEIISEQELLDSGLHGCVDSARFGGTPLGVFPFFFEGPLGFGPDFLLSSLCGALGPGVFFLSTAGLFLMKPSRRRR